MPDRLNSDECSKYLKALGDPERLRIIQCLQAGPQPVGEICRRLNSVVPNISHHLKQLRIAGLISGEKRGRFVYYELTPRLARHPDGTPVTALDFGCCRLELTPEQ